MRKTVFVFLLVLATVVLPGCGGTNPAPVTTPTDAGAAAPRKISPLAIEVGRGAARIVIASSLKSAGVSDDATAIVMQTLRKGVDAAIAGQDIRAIVTDPALWKPWRDGLVNLLAGVLADLKLNGVQIYDRTSAEALVSAALDAAAQALRD